MNIEPNFNKIKIDGKRSLIKKQVVVGCNISPQEQQGIKKILGVEGVGRVLSLEAMVGEAKLNGVVNFKVLYLDNDNDLHSLDYMAEFSESVSGEEILPQSKLQAAANVIDITVSATDSQVKISSVTELAIDDLHSEEISALIDIDDSCLKQIKDIKIQNLMGSGEGTFDVSEEFETNTNIDKILLFDAGAVISDVKCGIDNVLVTGEIVTDITYKGSSGIVTKCFSMPYSEEVTVNGAFSGQKVSAHSEIVDSKIILSGNENNNLIKAQVQLNIKVNTFEDKQVEVVADIYSADNELEVTNTAKEISYYNGCKFYNEKINGTANLDVQMAPIKDIITTSASRNVLTNLVSSNGAFTAEGIVSGAVIYEDDDGEINSVQVELPYSLELKSDDIALGDDIKGRAVVSNIYARAKRDREIEAIAELKFYIEIYSKGSLSVIENIEVGEEKIAPKNAISVYLAEKGEKMWDIAKALNMKPEEILKQNPDIEEPLQENKPICIFRQLSLD